MAFGAVLVTLGLVGLTVAGWLTFPPLALVPISAAAVAAGLLIDWEALRGHTAKPHRPKR